MKIHSLPAGLTVPQFEDALNENGRYDYKLDDRNNQAFFAEVKAKLISMGYTKPLTGEVVRYPMGDGYAAYSIAEGKTTFLVHLPIGDAWTLPEWQTRGIRKADLIDLVKAEKRLAKLFSRTK